MEDLQLLRRYAEDNSETAFGELVARHVNLVYSAALRRTGGDAHLAQDVAQLVFTDPRVNFAAVFDQDATPAERRQRLEAFEQAAPNNALANYLSALDYFKSGQTGQAVRELNAASTKSDGQTVQDQLDQVTQQRDSIKALAKQVEAFQETMSPQDWINYNERIKTFGEMNALQWLLGKYGRS